MSRGNGKSPEAAGLALHDLRTRQDSPDVFCGAAAKDQGRILLDFAREFVEGGPLADRMDVQRNTVLCPRTNGVLTVLSADGALQHGKSVSGWYGDEYHAFSTPKQEELHVAMMTALFKRANSAALMNTTAGWDKDTLLGRMYEGAINHSRLEERDDGYLLVVRDYANQSLFWWRQVPLGADIEDPKVIRRANPASWIDVRDLLRVLHDSISGIDENDFRRLHCNQWTGGKASWIKLDAWLALLQADPDPVPVGSDICIAVDAGLSHDTTALSWSTRHADRRVGTRCHVWSAREEAPHHTFVPGGRIDLDSVEEYIMEELRPKYRIRELVYDPRFFEQTATRLANLGLPVAPMHQGTSDMRDAEQWFHDIGVGEQQLAHDGGAVLRQHVTATTAEITDRGWKVRKAKQASAIDAAIATIMSAYRASRYEPSIYQTRGMRSI